MPSAERDPTEPGVRSRRSTRGRPLPIKTRALPIETPRRAHDRPFNPRRAFAEKKDALDAAIRGRRFARRRRCRLLPPVPAILLDAIAPPLRAVRTRSVGAGGSRCRSRRGAPRGFAPRRWSRARAGRRSRGLRARRSRRPRALASVAATRSRRRRRDATVVASAWRRAGAGARPGSRRRPRAPRRGEGRARCASSCERTTRAAVRPPLRALPRVAALSLAGRSARPISPLGGRGVCAPDRDDSAAVRSLARTPTPSPDGASAPIASPRARPLPPAHPARRGPRPQPPPSPTPPLTPPPLRPSPAIARPVENATLSRAQTSSRRSRSVLFSRRRSPQFHRRLRDRFERLAILALAVALARARGGRPMRRFGRSVRRRLVRRGGFSLRRGIGQRRGASLRRERVGRRGARGVGRSFGAVRG